MPILFLSPTDLLFYRHLHGNAMWNYAVFSINYFHFLITNFRRQTFHCWPPQEWIVLQQGYVREMSPQWKQKGMKTLCLIYINPDTNFPVISLLNLYLLIKEKCRDPGTVIPLELLHSTGAIVLKSKSAKKILNDSCLTIGHFMYISAPRKQDHHPLYQALSRCSEIVSFFQI